MKQRKNRFLSAFLAVLMLVGMMAAVPTTARAADIVDSGNCGANGDNLTYTLDSDGTLTISGTGEMKDYNGERKDAPWHNKSDNIKTITIKSGVTSIGEYAFCSCNSLTSVNISKSVTSIGMGAFCLCNSLTRLEIPDSVTSMGDQAFAACKNLASVTIGSNEIVDNTSTIGSRAFESCNSLTSVIIGNSVTGIEYGAFEGCSSLKSITIPNSITIIREYAFAYCTKLANVNIPNSVTSISESAFDGTALYKNEANWENGVFYIDNVLLDVKYNVSGSFVIKSGIRLVANGVLSGNRDITGITVATGNSVYSSENGVLFNKDKTELIQYPGGKNGVYTIPDSVKRIGDGAFQRHEKITGVNIPNGVTSIGYRAFEQCYNLTGVTIPNSVTSIGDYAFAGCDALTSVEIPNSVTNIGVWAFKSCGLNSVTIGDGMTSIGEAFCYCSELNCVTIPVSVTSIEEFAFGQCNNIKDVYYRGTKEQWEKINIGKYNGSLTKATIHYNNGATGDDTPTTPTASSNPFTDVNKGAYYYDAVLWALNHDPQITTGTTVYTFSPNDTCTRGQVVTFLWRAAGCPEPTGSNNPFTDVKPGDYYYKAVLWAVEKNITKGTGATTFTPNDGCTRGQVVTFLHRFENTPSAGSASNPFADVKTGAYYNAAVLWAVKNDITTGTGAGKFSPDDVCTRGQIVTFLYRDMAEK